MARYTGSVCRLCRREGEKLFLKGDRCYSSKCAIERRDGAPGVHGKAKGRFSEFKLQLREKQKVKRMYGLLEKQFRNLFRKVDRQKGVTGEELLKALESRLDNMVYRSGFASSRSEGRQMVRHGHVLVNDKKQTIPSLRVISGDVISIKEKSHSNSRINESLMAVETRQVPDWIELNKDGFKAIVKDLPSRDQLTHPMKEQLIVELYSK